MNPSVVAFALSLAGFLPPQSQSLPPGIEAVFMLTAEQHDALIAARNEELGTDAVRAAVKTSNDEDATEEQKAEATKVLLAACDKIRERATAILTPEQVALSAKLKAAFAEVQEPLWAELREQLRDPGARIAIFEGRANPFRQYEQKLKAAFAAKLQAILTEEQKAAMAKAAAEAEARNPRLRPRAGRREPEPVK